MTREERAKQFMPFDAMKGLQEALRDREEKHTRVERHEIPDEDLEHNNFIINMLSKGSEVRIECWEAFHDVEKHGSVTEINIPFRYLKLDGVKIGFDNIYRIDWA